MRKGAVSRNTNNVGVHPKEADHVLYTGEIHELIFLTVGRPKRRPGEDRDPNRRGVDEHARTARGRVKTESLPWRSLRRFCVDEQISKPFDTCARRVEPPRAERFRGGQPSREVTGIRRWALGANRGDKSSCDELCSRIPGVHRLHAITPCSVPVV